MTYPQAPLQGAIWGGFALPYLPTAEPVTSYGVVGDGITDDTAAIQAMINYFRGNAAFTNGGSSLKAPIYFPPGTYKVTSDIQMTSLIAPCIMGYGATIVASGNNFSKAVLLLDGWYRGGVFGLTIIGDGTEQVPSAIKLDYSTAGYRSTTTNLFEDITIRNLNYVTGLDLSGTGSNQLDGTLMKNVYVAGQQSHSNWSNTGNWQNGLLLGNGTFANNYDHVGFGVNCSGHYINYNVNVSSLSLTGAQPANGFLDFSIFPNAQCTIQNVQTQNCNQFMAEQGFSAIPVSFEDCLIKSNYINSSGYVGTIVGGIVKLKNFCFSGCQAVGSGVYGGCLIHVTNDGSASRYATLTAENVSADGLKTATILPAAAAGNANIVLLNYANYNPSTGNYTLTAGDIISYYTGTAWTTIA